MKSFKDYLVVKGSNYSFREMVNELTDAELEHRVRDYIHQQFKILNLHGVMRSGLWEEIEYDQLRNQDKDKLQRTLIKELEKDHQKMGLPTPEKWQKAERLTKRIDNMVFFACGTEYFYSELRKIK